VARFRPRAPPGRSCHAVACRRRRCPATGGASQYPPCGEGVRARDARVPVRYRGQRSPRRGG
jgi:hypothetical protein